MWAAEPNPYLTITKILIAEANVSQPNNGGNTLLHYAADIGHPQLVELLIKSGANVNQLNEESYTPLHYALHRNNIAIVQSLIDAGIDVNLGSKNPLEMAVKTGFVELTEPLIKAGAEVNQSPTLLHTAVEHGYTKIAQSLLDAGAYTDLGDTTTPLQIAQLWKYVELTTILETHGDILDHNLSMALTNYLRQKHLPEKLVNDLSEIVFKNLTYAPLAREVLTYGDKDANARVKAWVMKNISESAETSALAKIAATYFAAHLSEVEVATAISSWVDDDVTTLSSALFATNHPELSSEIAVYLIGAETISESVSE